MDSIINDYLHIALVDAMNVNLGEYYEMKLRRLIVKGIAANKTEVLRMGLIKLGEDRERLGGFIAKNANRDIWENKKEDAIWDKY